MMQNPGILRLEIQLLYFFLQGKNMTNWENPNNSYHKELISLIYTLLPQINQHPTFKKGKG